MRFITTTINLISDLQEVIALNPLNVVSCRKANGFSYMLQTLSDMKFPWVLSFFVLCY